MIVVTIRKVFTLPWVVLNRWGVLTLWKPQI